MAAYVAVFLPAELVQRLVTDAWASEGFVRQAGIALGAHARHVTLDPYASGCVVKIGASAQSQFVDSRLERALGERVIAAGGSLAVIDADFELSRLVEWDRDGRRVGDLANPDWASGQRRYEDGDQRIARRHLEEVAEARLGARKRGSTTLFFKAAPPSRRDEVLRAIDEGASVAEITVQGKPAFRFLAQGATRTVILSDAETAEVRARLGGA